MNNIFLICLYLFVLDSFWLSSFLLSAFICSWPPNSISVPLLSIPLSLYSITVSPQSDSHQLGAVKCLYHS